MGDLRDWSPELNGAVLEERPAATPSLTISAQCWQKFEAAAQGIIAQVQPTLVSEERRKQVIDYVQRLIRNSIVCEVFPFGSVPLKTYLPDGDIDLTAFGGMNIEEALAGDVFAVLEREDQNSAAEFVVKDVQLIRAEVKLVKCLVQNIVVDISFNQFGGLCTLCFLEKVDCLIGKDHLFKRSIILIKAWCYYESRILGAHHGLISTYALETLVLYIFHFFHSSLNGPLAVLYKFLDYFSKFDWDNYCISLNGPVRISSLPEVVVETPENGGLDLLLSNDFLNSCLEMFSFPARGLETNSRTFPPKHLNIVDPLKENNNLGRSVSKGNFYRIRSAFTYGARKLGQILSKPEENFADELCKFFSNTLDRHGSGQRPDVQDPVTVDGRYGFSGTASFSGRESFQENQTTYESESANSSGMAGEFKLDQGQGMHGGVNPVASGREMSYSRTVNEPQNSENGSAALEHHLPGDLKDLATSIKGLQISNHTLKSSEPTIEDGIFPLGKAFHTPHLYFSRSAMGNREVKNGNPEWKHPENSTSTEKKMSSVVLPVSGEETANIVCSDLDDNQLTSNNGISSPVGSVDYHLPFSSRNWSSGDLYSSHSGNLASSSKAGGPDNFNSLADLSGNYDSHLNNLRHGWLWYEYASTVPAPPPPLVPQFQSKNSWDVIRRSVWYRQNFNGAVPRPVLYPVNPSVLPGAAFVMEEMQKPRGTGTYFPNANHYRDRPFTPRGRNHPPARSPRNNGRVMPFQEPNLPERKGRELPQTQFHIHQGGGMSGSSDLHHLASPETKTYSSANGPIHLSERAVEFGPMQQLSFGAYSVESDRQPNSDSAPVQNSSTSIPTPGLQSPKPVINQDRIAAKTYRLKDEEDFPPLSDSSGKGTSINAIKKHERTEQ